MSRVLSLPRGSANTCQSLSGQDKSCSTAGGLRDAVNISKEKEAASQISILIPRLMSFFPRQLKFL